MAGLVDLVRNGDIPKDSTVLYAHLGGQPALNAYAQPVRRLPSGSRTPEAASYPAGSAGRPAPARRRSRCRPAGPPSRCHVQSAASTTDVSACCRACARFAAACCATWDSSSRWCCWSRDGWRSGRGSWRCSSSRCWCRPRGRRMRPNRWLLGGLAVVVVAATAVVVLLPDGRLPIPPGGGLLVTPSYDGHAAEPQPIALERAAAPGAGGERQQLDARRRLGDRQLPGSGAAREGPRGDDVVVRPGGVRDARLRPGRPAGRALRQPHRPGAARPRPRDHATARDPRPARPRGVRQAAVGGPLRRRLLLPRRARRARSSRPPTAGCSPSTATGSSQVDEVDLGDVVPDDDCLVALLPDWEGNTWYVTQDGRVGVAGGAGDRPRSTSTARSPTRSPPTTPASTW